jgi:RND family efflux transporter MFP subunit
MTSRTTKILLPIALLLVGVAGAVLLAYSRRPPERVERPVLGPLVEVMTTEVNTVDAVVRGTGEVRARTTVEIVPQVAGMVVDLHRELVPGGRFAAGETLVQIEPRDYELAVERAQASVARSIVNLEREQAEAEVARQEWDALHPGEAPSSGLVVREPQVRQAEAELAAARADLAVARLNLKRTRISLPFPGVVVSESVDLGQFASIGRTLATVYGTDEVEVRVPLPERELAWIDLPPGNSSAGPEARVIASFAGREHVWSGRVVRMEAQVDPSSRMIPVVVSVKRPFDTSGGGRPLLPGSFVEVEILGGTLENVVPVPRHAIHEGDTVWVVEDENLRIRQVEVVRTDLTSAFIGSGLEGGDSIVVSSLDAVTDGMLVRATEAASTGGGA